MSLTELIQKALELKTGNREFALFYFPPELLEDPQGQWTAMIGNPTNVVMLGEVSGEFEASGQGPKEAVQNLIAKLS